VGKDGAKDRIPVREGRRGIHDNAVQKASRDHQVLDLERGSTIADVSSRLDHLLKTTVDAQGKPLVEDILELHPFGPPPEGFVWSEVDGSPETHRLQTGHFVVTDKKDLGDRSLWTIDGQLVRKPSTDSPRLGFRPRAKSFQGASSGAALSAAEYIRRVAKYPRLTRDEEVLLGQAIEIGKRAKAAVATLRGSEPAAPEGFVWSDLDKCESAQLSRMADRGDLAFKLLLLTNLSIVTWVARHYFSSKGHVGDGMMDLIQDGNCGLMKSIEKWDWRKGILFRTYASNWIRQHISRGIQSTTTIRVPEHMRHKVENMRRVRNKFFLERNRQPSDEELCQLLGVKLDTYTEWVRIEKGTVSCDCPLKGNGNASFSANDEQRSWLDIKQCSNHTPDEYLAHQTLFSEIALLVDELPSTEQFVLKHRFGFDGLEPKSLYQVGELLGMSVEQDERDATRARVGRMQKKAIKQLLQTHGSLLVDLRQQINEDANIDLL
jgi:RNA polymerase primary sigma factor